MMTMMWCFLVIASFFCMTGALSFTAPHKSRQTSWRLMSSTTTISVAAEHPQLELSAAERIAKATTFTELLDAEQHLIHPGEETKHYHHQLVHQRKRQRAATNALIRIIKFLIGVAMVKEREDVLRSIAFHRLVVSATSKVTEMGSELPWADGTDVQSYIDALRALGALAPLPSHTVTQVNSLLANFDASFSGKSPEVMSLSPARISAIEWTYRRLNTAQSVPPSTGVSIMSTQSELKLPFKILHGLAKNITHLGEIRREVSFKSEILTTRDGRVVNERRETCWMADDGIGGLAYSGKIMSPVPFADCVARVRDAIEQETGVYYDCCLLNWYQDGECACKFHSDPDHGKVWARDTVVVSVGETRRFNLRAIPDSSADLGASEEEQEHHSFHLFDGDVFYMFGDCQDAFQHAVLKSEGPTNNSPRASIVFKKSLPGPGGRRGHGLVKGASTSSSTSSSSSSKPAAATTSRPVATRPARSRSGPKDSPPGPTREDTGAKKRGGTASTSKQSPGRKK